MTLSLDISHWPDEHVEVIRSKSHQSYIVVKRGERIVAYLNRCPHVGYPLDFDDGNVQNDDGSALMCHSHGAEFCIDSGECFAGPCIGEMLTPIILSVTGSFITIDDA